MKIDVAKLELKIAENVRRKLTRYPVKWCYTVL